jgi:hypothetical protein
VPGYLKESRATVRDNLELEAIHYVFECWPSDDIGQSNRVIFITERLAEAIMKVEATGFRLKTCNAIKGEQFEIVSPAQEDFPRFYWLDVYGKAGVDDFGISSNLWLVVSERILNLLQDFSIERAQVARFM